MNMNFTKPGNGAHGLLPTRARAARILPPRRARASQDPGRYRLPTARLAALTILALLLTGTAQPAPLSEGPPGQISGRRIVSIADIHGAFDSFTAILREVGLVDEDLNWTGGDTIMVQTGDFTDRGPDVRPAVDLLMRLQEQAPEQGGEVIVTLGNHEAMNLVGFLRDNSESDAAGFVDDDSPERQEEAWDLFTEVRHKRAESLDKPEPVFTRDVRRLWEETHPQGYVERVEALSPDGDYGRWLRRLPTAVRIGNVLFMHAGLNPEYADLSVDEINERISGEIQKYDQAKEMMVDIGLITPHADLVDIIEAADMKLVHMMQVMEKTGRRPDADGQRLARTLDWLIQYQSWQLLTREGLLWFRGLAQWPEDEHAEEVAEILKAQGVDHIVVGHSVQLEGDARARFNGALFLTDTGMLTEVYGGRPSALEIKDGTFTAVYVGERKQLYPIEGGVPGGAFIPVAANLSRSVSASPQLNPRPVWLGVGGTPLPFTDDEEVLAFLRTADVLSMSEIDSGKTQPQLVELEKDGVRARAIFHDVDSRRELVRVDGRFREVFHDSWRSQVAAYAMARLLGFDNVAPTVARTFEEHEGSLQLWLENPGLRTNNDRLQSLDHPPDIDSWLHQEWSMEVFDALVFNEDRHGDNILVDDNWTLWMIDHTRAFQTDSEIHNREELERIERGLLARLRDLDDDQLVPMLGPYIERAQINSILDRRDAILEHFEELIEERGEAAVVYDASTRTMAL